MELISAPVKRTTVRKGWEETRIIFIGDIQWAGKTAHGTALSQLNETIAEGLERGAYFIGMGDYIDFASPSNRQRIQAAGLYDTALGVIDEKGLDLTDEIFDLALKPTVGRWLGIVEGHHHTELRTGDTTDMRLAAKLGTTFLGTCGVIRVVFNQGTKELPVTIWIHHGHGNGQTSYYPLARLEKTYAENEGIDTFAIGHTTKMGAIPKNRMGYKWDRNGGSIYHRTVYLIGTGGYSRAYVEGARQGLIPRGGYAEQQMMTPAVIGSPTLIIKPQRYARENRESISSVLRVEV